MMMINKMRMTVIIKRDENIDDKDAMVLTMVIVIIICFPGR